jgi:hypothetical protein
MGSRFCRCVMIFLKLYDCSVFDGEDVSPIVFVETTGRLYPPSLSPQNNYFVMAGNKLARLEQLGCLGLREQIEEFCNLPRAAPPTSESDDPFGSGYKPVNVIAESFQDTCNISSAKGIVCLCGGPLS